MNEKVKILFVRSSKSSFIQKDLELLRKHFDVKVVDFVLSRRNLKGTLMTPFKIFKGVLWTDLTFSWFAGTHAFWTVRLSKIFRKKAIVVVGGFEVAKVPEIGYGALLNPRSARMVKYVLENADKVLTVDESLKNDAIKNVGVNGKNIQTVPTGYDYEKFKPKGKKDNLVITVGYITDAVIRRKGFDTFIKTVEYLPNVKFALIGKHVDNSIEFLKKIAPQNVEFTGFVSDEELIKYYQRAKVYCQLSMREGLPNALCEAMLCECVPVGTKNCGIPTAIGEAGFYVPYGDEKATAEAIKKALNSDKGKAARERIEIMFPTERRERELKKIIKELTK
jgi:glycosyltransferase involved in cell wall biosynthesis